MRCTVISKGVPLDEIQVLLKRIGASGLRVAPRSGQVFCDLPASAIASLEGLAGVAVKVPGRVRTQQVYEAYGPMTGTNAALAAFLEQVREAMTPPILGEMWKVAVLDTGIRSTHILLRGKVIHERNYTSSPTASDVFDHGTAVAGLIGGGRPTPGEEQGVAPGVKLLNIKVLGDDGMGNEEDVVMGIEDAIEQGAKIINCSFGTEDIGDPDTPTRVAGRAAYDAGVIVDAAAGNTGPDPGSIVSPACDEKVWAVGALGTDGYVADFSARGPTREGLVKPDVMFYGQRLLLASSRGDEDWVVKSGTSFACAGVAGSSALVQEGVVRVFERQLTQEENWTMIKLITRKPPTAPRPPAKDNEYGWGMAFGDLAATFARPTAIPVAELITPILAIGMMGTIMKGMVPTQ